MARIIVHIGAHKTATTYIQNRFAKNRERLREHALIYPTCIGASGHPNLAGVWINTRLTNQPDPGAPRVAQFKAFVDEHAQREGLVLISHEAFSRYLPERVDMAELADFLAPFEDARVVFTVREQPGYVQSIWMQRSKKSDNVAKLDAYIERTINTGFANGLHADFNHLYDRVVAGFGADRVSVLTYDALSAHQDGPFGAFLDFLGVDEPADSFADLKDIKQSNISPSPLHFELARRATAPTPPCFGLVEMAIKAMKINGPTSLLTRDQRARIVEKFEPLNAALVEKVRQHQPGFTFQIPAENPNMVYFNEISDEQREKFNVMLARRKVLNRLVARISPSWNNSLLGRRHSSLIRNVKR